MIIIYPSDLDCNLKWPNFPLNPGGATRISRRLIHNLQKFDAPLAGILIDFIHRDE